MAYTPLGRPVLEVMYAGNGRLTLANRTREDRAVLIASAAIVWHGTDGPLWRQMVWELDLAAGEAESIETPEALDQTFGGIELLLRLFSTDRGWRDVYIASPPDATPARQWEAGLRSVDDAPEQGELFVAESEGLVAYLRSES